MCLQNFDAKNLCSMRRYECLLPEPTFPPLRFSHIAAHAPRPNLLKKVGPAVTRYEYLLPAFALLPPAMLPFALADPGLVHPADVLAGGLAELRLNTRSACACIISCGLLGR